MTESDYNKRIQITVSDPWDFGTECGVGPFLGTIRSADDKEIVLQLDRAISFKNVDYSVAVLRVRHQGDSFKAVRKQGLAVNILLSPIEAEHTAGRSDSVGALFVVGSASIVKA